MPTPESLLPLKDLVFRILLTLGEGERHGWGLVQALAETGDRVLPGHLYRTLDSMLDLNLIEERDAAPAHLRTGARGATPTRFFKLTTFGRTVVRAETARLEALIARSRAAGLAAKMRAR
jgi:DNA-binding PadR family transcriptional regulator